MTAHVTVLYFASLRDAAEVASESFETAAPDLRVLYLELRARYGFELPVDRLRVAVDGAFAFGQRRICFVAQPVHAATVVLVADPAFETGVAADAVVKQARAQRGDVERGIGELET